MRGGLGDGSGTGSAPGDGTVGVARDGGGISVTDPSITAGLGLSASKGCAAPAGSVAATAPEVMPLGSAALGAPPGTVAGDRASLAGGVPASETLGDAGRMLGGGGRKLGELAPVLGGIGRMLGGGGRDRPRTGGGGGVPDGRDNGAEVPAGRGGNETGRGGCATGRGGKTDVATAGAPPAVSPVGAARFSLSLALPCSSPMGSPSSRALTSIARPFSNFVRERPREATILEEHARNFQGKHSITQENPHAEPGSGALSRASVAKGRSSRTSAYL